MKTSYLETLEAQMQVIDGEIATIGPLEIVDLDEVVGGVSTAQLFNENGTCDGGHFDKNGTCN